MRFPQVRRLIQILHDKARAPLRFPRLTTRRLMYVVAAVALVLGGERWWRHYQSCSQVAMRHDAAARTWSHYATSGVPAYAAGGVAADPTAMIEHEDRLRRKYERAAFRPWEPIPPDPLPSAPGLVMDHWLRKRDYGRVLAACDEAIRVDPTNYHPHYIRAWILASCVDGRFRDGGQAVVSATRACELSGWKRAFILAALASACAETGDFDVAVEWQRRALNQMRGELPRSEWLEKEGLERLNLYRDKRPYRAVPDP